ncbi:MAG TPA: trehalase family glycosidase [Polyangia bacterium]
MKPPATAPNFATSEKPDVAMGGTGLHDGGPHRPRLRLSALALLVVVACRASVGPPPPSPQVPAAAPLSSGALDPDRLAPVRAYIAGAWATLTRSHEQLPEAAIDPKFPQGDTTKPLPVFVATSEDRAAVARTIASVLPPARAARIELRPLAARAGVVNVPGLLYLPRPYVVPGGRFNEMYGWDSYFIVLGLLRDGQVKLARDQTDNFLYEVAHYGKVLNANRTYYLSRSQPPLISGMVRAVYAATRDREWLEKAQPALLSTHKFWTSPPHLAGDTGLSRYFDTGTGPAPEVESDERDGEGRTHYDRARTYYETRTVDAYDADVYFDRQRRTLTPQFFVGDRSMRESGFDPSERWGPFGVDVTHYAPVCLNVLLAVLEQDLAEFSRILGDPEGVARWEKALAERRARIDRYLWDAPAGLYFDWNFTRGARRVYPFATTFWPLWAGLASPTQAMRVHAELPRFERPGGIRTSDRETGNQWDAPFGWAPLQLFAVLGLKRYGHEADARRIADSFLSMVVEDFERRGTILEKYDVERRDSQVEARIHFGYADNQVGFGWTNGVFLELLEIFFPGRT